MNALRAVKPGVYADCGDSVRGSQTVYHRVEPELAELDAAGVDVQGMGNREFHYIFGAVRARAAQMKHPLTCANLIDTKGRALPFTADVVLRRDDEGGPWTLRFFGLLVVQYPTGSPWERLFGWRFLDPIEVAQQIADTTPPDATLIALSHLGLQHDRLLARHVPRLELILGGHSHDTLKQPQMVGPVPIIHAGPYGKFVSATDLQRNAARGRYEIEHFALLPLLQTA